MSLFLDCIADGINWDDEVECFSGLIDQFSSLYSVINSENEKETKRLQKEIQDFIFPALQTQSYMPSVFLRTDESIIQV